MLDSAGPARTDGRGGVQRVLHADGLLRVVLDGPPGQAVVHLVGEADTTNSRALGRALADAHQREPGLTIDAGRLSFVDVSGARTLLGFSQWTSAPVRNVSDQLRRLLTLLDVTL
jgi:anti-anti-sigma regulatory factor